jgi:hypothetical protein
MTGVTFFSTTYSDSVRHEITECGILAQCAKRLPANAKKSKGKLDIGDNAGSRS